MSKSKNGGVFTFTLMLAYGTSLPSSILDVCVLFFISIVNLGQMGGRKTGIMSIDNTTNSGDVVDVPLLLYRSLGSCLLFTLRTLSISSRRDCANMNQVGQQNTMSGRTNAQKQQRPTFPTHTFENHGRPSRSLARNWKPLLGP